MHTNKIIYCTLRGRIKAKKCAVYVVHKVVINCITVLYEPYSTVMCLIGHIMPLISSYSTVICRLINLLFFWQLSPLYDHYMYQLIVVKYNIPFKALPMLVCMKHSTQGCLVLYFSYTLAAVL